MPLRETKEAVVSHPNEERLREVYAIFAKGDLPGFLDGCTDDVTFTVPGNTPGSGTFSKATFMEWITAVLGQTAGTGSTSPPRPSNSATVVARRGRSGPAAWRSSNPPGGTDSKEWMTRRPNRGPGPS